MFNFMDLDIDKIPKFTIKEFQDNFESLMTRVENGEYIIITDDDKSVIVVPFNDAP